jgi:hypothetical protein
MTMTMTMTKLSNRLLAIKAQRIQDHRHSIRFSSTTTMPSILQLVRVILSFIGNPPQTAEQRDEFLNALRVLISRLLSRPFDRH